MFTFFVKIQNKQYKRQINRQTKKERFCGSEDCRNLQIAAPNHAQGDVGDGQDTHVGDPVMLVHESGQDVRRHPHQEDGQGKAENQNFHVILGGASDSQNVVQGHRDVGDDNGDQCFAQS